MLIDMVEEVYKDISADDQGGATVDPFAEEMRKALENSHKKNPRIFPGVFSWRYKQGFTRQRQI